MSRWLTGEEAAELVKRAKTLLRRMGRDVPGNVETDIIRYVDWDNVQIRVYKGGRVTLSDKVAGVLTFDYESEGISELFGGSATPMLRQLRKKMVLDDLADLG